MDVSRSARRHSVLNAGLEAAANQEISEKVVDELDERKKKSKKRASEAPVAQQLAKRQPVREVKKEKKDERDTTGQQENPYDDAPLSFNDTVELTQVKWRKNSEGEVDVDPQIESPTVSSVDLKYEAREILRTKGHEINFMGQLPRLKQSFIQNYVQSKSSSPFVAKYGAFKVGVIGQTLSMLGVNSEDIVALKQKAHSQAIKENVDLMGETIYNLELMELVYGNGRKTKNSRQMLAETQQKLIGQMNALDKGHYWNEDRLLEEKIKQLGIILEEFRRDHRALNYQYEFMVQEVNS